MIVIWFRIKCPICAVFVQVREEHERWPENGARKFSIRCPQCRKVIDCHNGEMIQEWRRDAA